MSVPLMKAIRDKNELAVASLIAKGADVNVKIAGNFALILASSHLYDDVAIVQDILAAGAKVNAKDCRGHSALMRASSCGNIAVVKVLLAAGAKVNAKDNKGCSALFRGQCHEDIVQVLLAAGADVNATNKNGETVLSVAYAIGKLSLEYGERKITGIMENDFIIQVLIAAGALLVAPEKAKKSIKKEPKRGLKGAKSAPKKAKK